MELYGYMRQKKKSKLTKWQIIMLQILNNTMYLQCLHRGMETAMARMLLGNLNGVGNSNCRPLHVVAFAGPLQGHIIPMFNFAKKLAAKGIIATFVNT